MSLKKKKKKKMKLVFKKNLFPNKDFTRNSFLRKLYRRRKNVLMKTDGNIFTRMGLKKFWEPFEDAKKGIFNKRLIAGEYNWIFGHMAFILTGTAFLSNEIITLREKAGMRNSKFL